MGRTQVTEQTGKTWKLLKLIGVLTMMSAIGLFFLAMGQADHSNRNAGLVAAGIMLFAFAGFPLYVFGRLGAWWFHA